MCRVPRFAPIAVLIQLLVSIAAFQLKRLFEENAAILVLSV